ncbi:hypothetical protein GEMRC1_013294 [Eukaryota sp. GEM-RC1]
MCLKLERSSGRTSSALPIHISTQHLHSIQSIDRKTWLEGVVCASLFCSYVLFPSSQWKRNLAEDGDVETNPGPPHTQSCFFNVCHCYNNNPFTVVTSTDRVLNMFQFIHDKALAIVQYTDEPQTPYFVVMYNGKVQHHLPLAYILPSVQFTKIEFLKQTDRSAVKEIIFVESEVVRRITADIAHMAIGNPESDALPSSLLKQLYDCICLRDTITPM